MALLDFAVEVVRDAASLVRQRLLKSAPMNVYLKSDGGGPVTETDTLVEELIVRRIRERLPDDSFLGEEGGRSGDSACCWVIDPIDGTRNFVHGYPHYVISLACCENGKPKLGVVHDLVADETFFAVAGGGAFAEKESHRQRLRVADSSDLAQSLFIVSGQMSGRQNSLWPLAEKLARKTAGFRRSGSTAWDFAQVAAGRAQMMVCGRVQFWDVAAGALLLREAGGLISDADGATAFVFGEETNLFVAGAPRVFVAFLGELKKHCQ